MLKLVVPILTSLSMSSLPWNANMIMMSMLPLVAILTVTPEPWVTPMNSLMTPDFLSTSLMVLTLWITPLMYLASQKLNITKNNSTTKFINMVNLLSMILIVSFTLNNLFTFYVMFEASLLPTMMIILTWGYQPERIQAGMYLMLYTIAGSLPLLIAIIIISESGSSLGMVLFAPSLHETSTVVWLVMNVAFMVKMPMFMTHLWLPKAHVEAPVAGSMILAAILLKLGGYGMMRMVSLIGPLSKVVSHSLVGLALWGGMITSLMCVRQSDMKSLIAYSSIGHMSLVLAGVVTNNAWGMWGALAMMIAHGLVSSAMFANANHMYETSGSRNLLMNKGIHIMVPTSSMLWFIMCAANMAAPPSINLLAEIMLITAALSSFSMIIPLAVMSYTAAAYSLILYTTMNHGFSNSSSTLMYFMKNNNITCVTLHLTPVFVMITSPVFISMW